MQDDFELPVIFDNRELSFPARLLNYTYCYKLEVDISGTKVLFEPDEERNWRALLTENDLAANKKISADLLRAIATAIETVTR